MESNSASAKSLLAAPPKPKTPASQLLVEVARTHKVSPFRQMREMVSLNRGPGRLGFHEYYSSGCFDADIPSDEKKQFVGEMGSFALNKKLSPLSATPTRAFVRDKVMYGALLEQLGFRTTQTQAVASTERSFGNIPTLKNAAEAEEFLTSSAVYPLFGKPTEGSKSVGSVLISSFDGASSELVFANGRKVNVTDFAKEVFADFGEGFIFQSAVAQHADMRRMTGDAVGTLRVVTLRDENGISLLYSAWKIPAPDAMSDNFWQSGSMIAEVDIDNGKLVKCKRGTALEAEWIEAHPSNGEAFAGYQIPFWEDLKVLATQAHALFPEFGVFGWDIAMTQDGPLIIECNANPFHSLYQLATGRGILNDDFKPRLDAAAAKSVARAAGRAAKRNAK
ncbi:MAG: sugar-transfer associated ATP-grasp domain-containing protein [Sulfitobacter sp.]